MDLTPVACAIWQPIPWKPLVLISGLCPHCGQGPKDHAENMGRMRARPKCQGGFLFPIFTKLRLTIAAAAAIVVLAEEIVESFILGTY